MKRFVYIVFVLLLFSACGNKSKTFVPNRLLTEQEMIDVMTDVQIIESDLNIRKSNQQDISGLAKSYYTQLFEHYGITDSIYSENMKYYTMHPAELERIMDSVMQRLTKEQSESRRDDSQ
jgi:hypothetical protein